ncbi:MAG: hypothetical protein MI723_03640 [Caulobacterales bacterium]|nr:hypothetical protein [Caulobacterales bacterium]
MFDPKLSSRFEGAEELEKSSFVGMTLSGALSQAARGDRAMTSREFETKTSQLVDPIGGRFGNRWEFEGGRRIRVQARTTHVLGLAGFRGVASVFALNAGGGVIPNAQARGRGAIRFGSHLLPLSTYSDTITANFESEHGYFWRVTMESARTVDNEGHWFFSVYR